MRDFWLVNREWQYKDVPRKIIAEECLSNESTDPNENALIDYKFFCFDGEPKIMYISRDKGKTPETDFFDMDFNHLPIRMKDPNAKIPPSKPDRFEDMKALAKTLSKGFAHIRVDFYVVNGKIYVGELTFHHCAGYANVYPGEWNDTLGDWINLPEKLQG